MEEASLSFEFNNRTVIQLIKARREFGYFDRKSTVLVEKHTPLLHSSGRNFVTND